MLWLETVLQIPILDVLNDNRRRAGLGVAVHTPKILWNWMGKDDTLENKILETNMFIKSVSIY